MTGSVDSRQRRGSFVTAVGAVVNLVLSVVKVGVGLWTGSEALLSDGIHSLSDLLSDGMVVLGLVFGARHADEDHPYGHGRLETLATGGVGLMLMGAAIGIGWSAATTLYGWRHGATLPEVSQAALWVALASMVSKEWLYRWTLGWGARLRSNVMIANAWHHRSDALSSLAVSIGIGAAVFLGPSARVADPITALGVSFFILWEAMSILRGVVAELMESSIGESDMEWIRAVVKEIPGLDCPHALRSRRVGNVVAVELHVTVDGSMPVRDAHVLVEELETRLRSRFGEDAIITVHMDPRDVVTRSC